ncbi:hypothetical protein ACVIGB_006094 [Bradyrhizobium sp. USDA 4341]
MPIGEFGGAPPLAAEGSPALTTPLYWMYEMAHASLNPVRAVTDATKILFQNPLNPWTHTEFGKSVAAGCELFERTTRRYGKPDWNLPTTEVKRHPHGGRGSHRLGKAVLPPAAFRSQADASAALAAAARADRGADVGPLCDAAAWHGRGVPADA